MTKLKAKIKYFCCESSIMLEDCFNEFLKQLPKGTKFEITPVPNNEKFELLILYFLKEEEEPVKEEEKTFLMFSAILHENQKEKFNEDYKKLLEKYNANQ